MMSVNQYPMFFKVGPKTLADLRSQEYGSYEDYGGPDTDGMPPTGTEYGGTATADGSGGDAEEYHRTPVGRSPHAYDILGRHKEQVEIRSDAEAYQIGVHSLENTYDIWAGWSDEGIAAIAAAARCEKLMLAIKRATDIYRA
jgi:hypothetical protein